MPLYTKVVTPINCRHTRLNCNCIGHQCVHTCACADQRGKGFFFNSHSCKTTVTEDRPQTHWQIQLLLGHLPPPPPPPWEKNSGSVHGVNNIQLFFHTNLQ